MKFQEKLPTLFYIFYKVIQLSSKGMRIHYCINPKQRTFIPMAIVGNCVPYHSDDSSAFRILPDMSGDDALLNSAYVPVSLFDSQHSPVQQLSQLSMHKEKFYIFPFLICNLRRHYHDEKLNLALLSTVPTS